MGYTFRFKMFHVFAHNIIIRLHIRHLGKADLVQRYADALRLLYQQVCTYAMHGNPVGGIVNGRDEVFDVDIGVTQAMIKRQRAVLAAAPVENAPRPLIFLIRGFR